MIRKHAPLKSRLMRHFGQDFAAFEENIEKDIWIDDGAVTGGVTTARVGDEQVLWQSSRALILEVPYFEFIEVPVIRVMILEIGELETKLMVVTWFT